jgi:dCTP deaminase
VTGVLPDRSLRDLIASGRHRRRTGRSPTPRSSPPRSTCASAPPPTASARASSPATAAPSPTASPSSRCTASTSARARCWRRAASMSCPLMERLALPPGISAVANAKSSTGRLDLLTRTITDGGTEFDRIPAGYHGPLYAEICPRSFSVLVREGQRLNQIRFRDGKAELSDADLARAPRRGRPRVGGRGGHRRWPRLLGRPAPRVRHLVGYRAKPHTGVIDLDRIGHYAPRTSGKRSTRRGPHHPRPRRLLHPRQPRGGDDPADPRRRDGALHGDGGRIPRALRGLLRSGLRLGPAGGAGSRGVLEVRCHEAPFVLEHGQVVGRLVYERMSGPPETLYGAGIASNYQGQGLKLSKHFRGALRPPRAWPVPVGIRRPGARRGGPRLPRCGRGAA